MSGFKGHLEQHCIILNDSDIFYGDFTKKSIRMLPESILNKLKEIDVIVFANDNMASGDLDFLNKNGVYVPDDVAVTGFDDSVMARVQIPNITTIQQSLDDMAKQAVYKLLELIEGNQVHDRITIPPRFILNQSCGCLESFNLKKGDYDISSFTDTEELKKILNNALQNSDSDIFIRKIQRLIIQNINWDYVGGIEKAVLSFLSFEFENNFDRSMMCDILYKITTFFRKFESSQLLQEHSVKIDDIIDNITETSIEGEKVLSSRTLSELYNNLDYLFEVNNINS